MKDHDNPFEQLNKRFDTLEAHLIDMKRKDVNRRMTRFMIKEEYHVSYGTIHNAMNSGSLKFFKLGRKTLFIREDVERWYNKGY